MQRPSENMVVANMFVLELYTLRNMNTHFENHCVKRPQHLRGNWAAPKALNSLK